MLEVLLPSLLETQALGFSRSTPSKPIRESREPFKALTDVAPVPYPRLHMHSIPVPDLLSLGARRAQVPTPRGQDLSILPLWASFLPFNLRNPGGLQAPPLRKPVLAPPLG